MNSKEQAMLVYKNAIEHYAGKILLSTADMRDLGCLGKEACRAYCKPDNVLCTFNKYLAKPQFSPQMYKATVENFQKLLINDRKLVFDLLKGDMQDFVNRAMFAALPLIVPTRSWLTPDNSVHCVTFNSCLQRIFLVDPEECDLLAQFEEFCYNRRTNKIVQFKIEGDAIRFEAQSLFEIGVNHDIGPKTIDALKDFGEGMLFKSGFWQNCVGTLCKLTTLVRHYDDLITVGATVVDLLLSWNVTFDIAIKLWEMITPYVEKVFAFFTRMVAQSDIIPSLDSEVVKSATAIMASLLAVIGTTALPSQKLIDSVLRRSGDIGKSVSGMKTILDMMKGIYDQVYGTVYEYIFGVPVPGDELSKFIEGISDWYDRVSELVNMKILDELSISYKVCRKIEKVHAQGMEIARRMQLFKLTAAQRQPFEHYWRIVVKLFDKVATNGARQHGPRTEPVIIQLFGASSVGKSGLTYLLGQSLLSCEGLEKDVLNEMYFRNVEQEYWDGYTGQAVCVYDDFGQVKDTSSKPNPEFMEIIRTGNIAPWPLHMAHLEDKAKTRFTSRACILTSNRPRFNMDSLTHAVAFMRRLDLYAEVTVNPAFATEKGRIDPTKTNGLLDPRVYLFTLYDEDSKPIMVQQRNERTGLYDLVPYTVGFDEFEAMAQDLYFEKFQTSTSKLQCLMARADSMVRPKRQIDGSKIDLKKLKKQHYKRIADEELAARADNDIFEETTPRLVAESMNYEYNASILLGHPVKCEKYIQSDALAILGWLNVKKLVLGEFPHRLKLEELALGSSDYDEFKQKSFEVLLQIDPNTTILSAAGTDDMWEAIENDIHDKHFETYSASSAAIAYAKKCKDQVIKSLSSLGEKIINDKAYYAYKAFGATFSFVCFTMAIKRLWNGENKLYNSLMATESAIKMKKTFTSESVDEAKIPKKANYFVSESVDLDRVAKRAVRHNAESVDDSRIPQKVRNFKGECDVDRPTASALDTRYTSEGLIQSKDGNEIVISPINDEIRISTENNDPVEYKIVPNLSRRAKKKNKLQAEAAIDKNAQELLNTTVKANTYLLCAKLYEEFKGRVNILFLSGRVALTVKHALRYFENEDVVRLRNPFNREGISVKWDSVVVRPFINSKGQEYDLVSLTFPRQVHGHANLKKHFVSLGDHGHFKTAVANLYCNYNSTIRGKIEPAEKVYPVRDVKSIDVQDYDLNLPDGGKEICYVRRGYTYSAETQPGDCGGPLVMSCPQMQRKILGVHVAGSASGVAMSQCITREMIDEHLKLIPMDAQVGFDAGEWGVDNDRMPVLPEGDFSPIGIAPVGVGAATKTQLRQSKLYGLVCDAKTKPAILRPFKDSDGELIDPMMKGLKKCGITNPLVNVELLERCRLHLLSKMKRCKYGEKKIFSFAEAIRGIEADPWIMPMNRKSSPGFPWCLQRGSSMGKTKWLGVNENYILDDAELQAKCEERIAKAKEGMRLPTLWTDTLKDERRPIAKVDEGKTRVFSAGSMDYILNVRQYFLAFNAALMDTRIDNEIALGVNPFSLDWHRLALHLMKKGPHVCAGDFSNFDGSLLSVFLWAVLDIINDWYDGTEEETQIRTVLFYDIVNSLHIRGDQVYQWTHSQPSGNPLTTVINCLMNSLIFRYIYIDITGNTLKDFDEHISFISYGDDNVINISPVIIEKFNQITISEACAKIGFTYTDEAKTGELVVSKTLGEINFLKRGFRRDEFGFYVAPLDLDTILEMTMWVRGDIDQDTRCAENLEICYKELSMHGFEVFDFWSKTIDHHAQQLLDEPPILYPYFDYTQMAMSYY
jgi:hypothetical protein